MKGRCKNLYGIHQCKITNTTCPFWPRIELFGTKFPDEGCQWAKENTKRW